MTDGWRLVYEGHDPEEETLRETLCTLGNGRFATRGAAEWVTDDGVHYPATYLAGGYNRLTTEVGGRDIVNEDLVNFPNWLGLSFGPEDGRELADPSNELSDYRQELDLRSGVLHRDFTVKDSGGRETRISSRRFVHMADPHLCGIEMEIVPLNWSGGIRIRSSLDGAVTNNGVARYRELRGDHISVTAIGEETDGIISLQARARQSGLGTSFAARTRLRVGDDEAPAQSEITSGAARIDAVFRFDAKAGCPIRIEKVVCLRTTRDSASGDLGEDAVLGARRAPTFEALVASHAGAWKALWNRYDVEVDVASESDLTPHPVQLILRLHTFHLLQTASPHSAELDVSVPARGLHGEAYRGHIFWDEMYLFPFYLQRDPELTRALLLYRYRRLGEARAAAAAEGQDGAMFPWQSGSSGREETQIIHLNPRSGTWDPDHSHLQRHISAAIAMNVWSYVETTDDRAFLERYGAEMLAEIARFWAGMASEREDGRFAITGVMGPDEFHEAYPGEAAGGVRNNAYTNVMAIWCIEKALAALDLLDSRSRKAVVDRISLAEEELVRWRAIASAMTIPVLPNGLIAQFEGYGDLKELDWDAYRARYGSIGRLDRILKAEGDSPDRYKLSKQADLCMLFYLFDPAELIELLASAGYELTEARLHETIEHYRRRTSHGSTLSHLVFAATLDRVDRAASWEHFVEALRSDVDDIQGGTTPEGIHTAVMAGTVRHVIERFAGLRLTAARVSLTPRLPEGIRRIRFTVRWRDVLVTIEVDSSRVRFEVPSGARGAVPVRVNGAVTNAVAGEPLDVEYTSSP
ncbi:MAG: glycosyl hydrolase family 65 protein [Candidatus Bipolaricaulia bacterium]